MSDGPSARFEYEWVQDPRTGMWWQRPVRPLPLTGEARGRLPDPADQLRCAMRYMRARYGSGHS